jgi:hypothetical protein
MSERAIPIVTWLSSDNKKAREESRAVGQEHEVAAEPGIESVNEADSEVMESETEEESEEHESEEVEDREDEMLSDSNDNE